MDWHRNTHHDPTLVGLTHLMDDKPTSNAHRTHAETQRIPNGSQTDPNQSQSTR